MEQMNIYQRLKKIGRPAQILQKNKKGYGYTYANEELLLSKITGNMEKYQVSLIPNILPGSSHTEVITNRKTKFTKDGKPYEEVSNEVLFRADMEWIWVCDDRPEERVVVPWVLVGSQADASQGFGSALTYASRYFLLKYFNCATSDDDPDEYRRRQAEAVAEDDKMIAEQIVNQIHEKVQAHLAQYPETRPAVIELTKKYVKENGRPSANYFAITTSQNAAELLNALNAEFFKEAEE